MLRPASRQGLRPAPLCRAGFLLLLALLLLWALPARALEVRGKAAGPGGRGVAGALVSDGVEAVLSDGEGNFSLDSREGRVIAVAAPPGWKSQGRWWWPTSAAQAGPLMAGLEPEEIQGGLRLAVFSDPHLFGPGCEPGWYSKVVIDPELPLAVWSREARAAAGFHPHLTLMLGDLCMDADKGDGEHARRQMELGVRAMEQLPRPSRALPGNHDVRLGEKGLDLSLWRELLGPARQVCHLGPYSLILLDNPAEEILPGGKKKVSGKLSQEALDWLEGVLKLIPAGRPLIIASHFPLASTLAGSNPFHKNSLVEAQVPTGLALRDTDQSAQDLARLLGGRKVALFLSGHEHALHQATLHTRQASLFLLAAPALCGRWWQGDRPWGVHAFAPGRLEITLTPENGVDWRMVEVSLTR